MVKGDLIDRNWFDSLKTNQKVVFLSQIIRNIEEVPEESVQNLFEISGLHENKQNCEVKTLLIKIGLLKKRNDLIDLIESVLKVSSRMKLLIRILLPLATFDKPRALELIEKYKFSFKKTNHAPGSLHSA